MNIQKKAFTLVELIVSITILAILGTIAFMSFQGYSANSRDSVRISDVSKMKTSLELFQLDAGKYPLPTDGFNVVYSGSVVWMQGSFGDSTTKNVTRLNKIPIDPLTNIEYSYSVTKTQKEYEIAGILETGDLVSKNFQEISYAGDSIVTAMVDGTYNGLLLKSLSGTSCEILSVPSIITSSDGTIIDLVEILDGGLLVYDGYNNLPSIYDGTRFKVNGGFDFQTNSLIVYNDTNECNALIQEDDTARLTLLENLQNAYSGTIIEDDENISLMINFDISETQKMDLISSTIVNNTLGGNLDLTVINNVNTGTGGEDEDVDDFPIELGNYVLTSLGGNGSDYLWAVAKDEVGNTYVGGVYVNDIGDNNSVKDFKDDALLGKSNTIGNDIFLAKLDSSLNQVWIKTLGGLGSDVLKSISVDTSGNIYVGGLFTNNLVDTNGVRDFDGTVLYGKTTNSTYMDGFVAKLNSSGDQQWIKVIGGLNSDNVLGVKVDVSGNIYVGGSYTGISSVKDFSNVSLPAMSSSSGYDIYVAKLDASGTQQWIKTMGGKGVLESLQSLATDSSGNVYVGGVYYNDTNDVNVVKDFSNNILYGKSGVATYSDGFVVKLDTSGTQQWIKTIGGSDDDYVYSVEIGSTGNVFVGGKFINTPENTYSNTDFGGNILNGKTENLGYSDAFVAQLNSLGTQQWIKTFGGKLSDSTSSITAGNSGSIYVGGNFYNNTTDLYDVTDFSNNVINGKTNGGNDAFVCKIDSSGKQLWIKSQKAYTIVGTNTFLDYSNGVLSIGGYYYNDINNTNNVLDFNNNILYGKSTSVTFDAQVIQIGN